MGCSSSVRVASATSACRIRLSPTRKACTPAFGQPLQVGMGGDSALGDDDTVVRHARREPLGGLQIGLERLRSRLLMPMSGSRAQWRGPVLPCRAPRRWRPCARPWRRRRACRPSRRRRRHDDEDAVGAPGAGLDHLVAVEHEVLAQHGQSAAARAATRCSGAPWNEGPSVSTERHAAPPAAYCSARNRGSKSCADQAFRRARLLDLAR